MACAAGALLVDPGAEAAFDAPKRLVALVGIAVAALAVLAAGRSAPRAASAEARLARGLAACAGVGVVAATLLAPHRVAALEAARLLCFGALVVWIGASPAMAGRGGLVVLGAVLAAALVNAVVSLLQAGGLYQPFAIEAIAGRAVTGAFIGNEGQLALTLALALIAGLALLPAVAGRPLRLGAAAGLLVLATALVVNATITALAAVAAGTATLLVARGGRRGVGAALAAVVLLGAAAAAWGPLRTRAREAAEHVRRGSWNDLTSNRLGPWAAAAEMTRAHPLAGVGPGGFAVEFVPRRLEAELRYRTRLVIPRITSSYGEAHNEYLQAAAELGVPTAIALAAAGGTVLAGLARRVRAGADVEATTLLAVLVTGAVAALTWFPLQRPASAVPLLLAWGRAWRIIG